MNSITKIMVLLFVVQILSGCALMRSRESGYTSRYDSTSSDSGQNYRYRDLEVRDSAATELGYGSYQRLTASEQRDVEDRLDLKRLERTFQSQREREQYYRYKPLMKSDRQRAEFIQVGSFEGRQRWLRNKGISGVGERHTAETTQLIAEQDVALGMSRQAVKQSWGDPDGVEVAGNPIYGNERWQYTTNSATTEGFNSEKRTIYFESGVVVGWERN